MKSFFPTALVFASLLGSSPALTDDDFAPAKLDGSTQDGGFAINSVATKKPEIDVIHSGSGSLIDGKSEIALGKLKVGKTGQVQTFTIKNTGSAPLKRIAVTKSGANKQDFIVSGPTKTTLEKGKTTKFTVKFKPSSKGTKKATIKIASNDADENPFGIKLSGSALPK